MMKKYFLILGFVLTLFFFSSEVYAQSRPNIVMEHIVGDSALMGPDPRAGSSITLINTLRNPNVEDVKDAMKKKKKVTVVIWLSNDTAKWPHAVRVVGLNMTSYNGTNVDNETVIYHFAEVYDPTTNSTYNLSFAFVEAHNQTGYLQWGTIWAPMRDVITVHKLPPHGGTIFKVNPFEIFVSLLYSKKSVYFY